MNMFNVKSDIFFASLICMPFLCASQGERFSLEVDGQFECYESELTFLISDEGQDFRPPKKMLDKARETNKFLYLRARSLLLVGGGEEIDWKWYIKGSDPSTYALKVYPRRKEESMFDKFESFSFVTKVIVVASVVSAVSVVAVSSWYFLALLF